MDVASSGVYPVSFEYRAARIRRLICEGGLPVSGAEISLAPHDGAGTLIPPGQLVERMVAIFDNLPEGERPSTDDRDKLITAFTKHGQPALLKLLGQDFATGAAPLAVNELGALESVVIADGTRPSFLLKNGFPPASHPFMGPCWANAFASSRNIVPSVARAVARVQPKGGDHDRFFGTACLIDAHKGLMVTNYHVLDEARLANIQLIPEGPIFRVEGLEVDFCGEFDGSPNRFQVLHAIIPGRGRRLFDGLDFALLRIAEIQGGGGTMPDQAINVSTNNDFAMETGTFCTIGFPGPPSAVDQSDDAIDWAYIRRSMFANRFGYKRIAPGRVTHGTSTSPHPKGKPFLGHDATTFAGASGSMLFAWQNSGFPAFALHFGGSTGALNHALSMADIMEEMSKALETGRGISPPAPGAGGADAVPIPATDDDPFDRVRRVVAWTRMDWLEFRVIYRNITEHAAAGTMTAAATIEAEEAVYAHLRTREEISRACIRRACEQAEKVGLLPELTRKLVRNEQHFNPERQSQADELKDIWGAAADMQGMTDRAKGLMNVSVLSALLDVTDATCYVSVGDQVLGTGFLIARERVMTSAHVALDNNGVAFLPALKPGLRFIFPASKTREEEVIRTPAANGLLGHSLPHGLPPNCLNENLGGLAGQNLDYALIGLSQDVPHRIPIDLHRARQASDRQQCFVIGFAGGTAMKFDADKIVSVNPPAGRILHETNTVPGMSGSCCIGAEGVPVGLHEGGIYEVDLEGRPVRVGNMDKVRYNRAVCLQTIWRAEQARQGGPARQRLSRTGFVLEFPYLVRQWWNASRRIAGDQIEQWRERARLILDRDVDDGLGQFKRHPWFPRPKLEAWIQKAMAQGEQPPAFVLGDPGTGKSFAAAILRGMLHNPDRDLVELTPTLTGDLPWRDAIAAMLDVPVQDRATRTEPGAIAYDEVPAMVERLRTRGGMDRDGNTPLFVTIDFGRGDRAGIDMDPWVEFMARLAEAGWARILVIGIDDSAAQSLRQRLDKIGGKGLADAPEFYMEPITRDDLADFIINLHVAHGVDKPKPSEVRSRHLAGISFTGPLAMSEMALLAMDLDDRMGREIARRNAQEGGNP